MKINRHTTGLHASTGNLSLQTHGFSFNYINDRLYHAQAEASCTSGIR